MKAKGLSEEEAALRIQTAMRGALVRKHYRVKSVPGAPGIVHTRVQGTSEHFARVGINVARRQQDVRRQEHVRTMDILSIDPQQYAGGVAGGRELARAEDIAANVSVETGRPTAFINASYFNYGDARNKKFPEGTPIGPTIARGEEIPSLPIPKPYKKDYASYRPGSSPDMVTTGPLLAAVGRFRGLKQAFKPTTKSKYNYRDKHGESYPTSAIPGYLHHAGDPNARSAISWPVLGGAGPADPHASARQDRIRMMTITPGTGRAAGFTMPELSAAATRVTSWNQTPGGAINLDGGGSSAMGVVSHDQRLLMRAGYTGPEARPLSTVITYGRK